MHKYLKRFGVMLGLFATGGSAMVAETNQSLDMQIAAFADVGLTLADGVSKDDLLISFPEDEFVQEPFSLLFFVYGNEVERRPWGRYVSDQVWNFDLEAIEDDDSYAFIIKRLAQISGTDHVLSDVASTLDWDNQKVSVSYKLGSIERALTPKFDNDWADADTIQQFLADIMATTNDGKQFWAADNGQGAILVYLDAAGAAKVNALSPDLIAPWN